MRIYYDQPANYPYLQFLEVMLTAKGHTVPKFDSAMIAGDPETPTFVQLYLDLKSVAAYGRGFGVPNYLALTDVPDATCDSLLVDTKTGKVLRKDDFVTSFRGEEYQVIDWRPGRYEDKSGRIVLADPNGHEHEFFPGVINALIVRAE